LDTSTGSLATTPPAGRPRAEPRGERCVARRRRTASSCLCIVQRRQRASRSGFSISKLPGRIAGRIWADAEFSCFGVRARRQLRASPPGDPPRAQPPRSDRSAVSSTSTSNGRVRRDTNHGALQEVFEPDVTASPRQRARIAAMLVAARLALALKPPRLCTFLFVCHTWP
jgi:hypothetical protein